MQALNGNMFLFFYYAGGVLVFVTALIPLLLVGFFTFSMLPSMLFSRFYDRMYKRLGFLPETTLFLLCCGLALTLTVNVMGSPPLCADPLNARNPQRLYVYQVTAAQGTALRATAHGPALGGLPVGALVYSPTPPDAAARLVVATRAALPTQPQPAAIGGLVAREQIAATHFLAHPFAFAERQCKPAFLADYASLLRWPW